MQQAGLGRSIPFCPPVIRMVGNTHHPMCPRGLAPTGLRQDPAEEVEHPPLQLIYIYFD